MAYVFRRLAEERRFLPRNRDFLIRLYDIFLSKFRDLPLPGRGCVAAVRPRGAARTFLGRLGSTDFFTLREIFSLGEYEFAPGLAQAPVRTVLDLGANVGYSTLFLAQSFPDAKIIAVEPAPGNVRMAILNINAAGLRDRVTVHETCVAATAGKRYIDTNRFENSICVAHGPGPGIIETNAVTIDSLTGGGVIDVLKCDIEGAEAELFRSCSTWINRVRFLMVETHSGYTPDQLTSDIRAAGGNFVVVHRVAKVPPMAVIAMRREVAEGDGEATTGPAGPQGSPGV